jgi:hypothetical protein
LFAATLPLLPWKYSPSLLIDARFLALAVLIECRFKSGGKTIGSPYYRKTISLLDAIYASDRLRLPLEGVPTVGY